MGAPVAHPPDGMVAWVQLVVVSVVWLGAAALAAEGKAAVSVVATVAGPVGASTRAWHPFARLALLMTRVGRRRPIRKKKPAPCFLESQLLLHASPMILICSMHRGHACWCRRRQCCSA